MNRPTLSALVLAMALAGCASARQQVPSASGSWFWKEGTSRDTIISRRLLIGIWHSESTDIHGVTRIEDATRLPNGTFVVHFVERSDSGKVTADQTECGRWGISGNIYFTITEAIRARDHGDPVSPYDASFYDAYVVLSLTKARFEYKHVESGQMMYDDRVTDIPKSTEWSGQLGSTTPCEGTST
jgi:hypothetical protein